MKVLRSSTDVSHCGATSGKLGFDDNAYIFENHRSKLSTVVDLVKMGKYNSAIIKITPTLINLGWQKITKR